jgi:predicted Zn-dependent protease
MRNSRGSIAIALVVIVVLFFAGIRISHPHEGLSNALGSAKSGLVIYKKGANFEVDSKVLITQEAPAKSPLLALVKGSSGDSVDIQYTQKLERVKKAQVYGKLIAVVPFLGTVLSFVGL